MPPPPPRPPKPAWKRPVGFEDAIEKEVRRYFNARLDRWIFHMHECYKPQVHAGRMMLVERHPGLLAFDGFVVRSIEVPEWHPQHVARIKYCDECNLVDMLEALRGDARKDNDWLSYESLGYRSTPRYDMCD